MAFACFIVSSSPILSLRSLQMGSLMKTIALDKADAASIPRTLQLTHACSKFLTTVNLAPEDDYNIIAAPLHHVIPRGHHDFIIIISSSSLSLSKNHSNQHHSNTASIAVIPIPESLTCCQFSPFVIIMAIIVDGT